MIGGDVPPKALANQMGFLMNWIGMRSRARFQEAMAELGLHPREFAVLTIISDQPGITQQAIGAETDIDASTMVAAIDSLEERGLAERRVHPGDRRKRSVHLTRKGQRLLERARGVAAQIGEETFVRLSAAERAQLQELLRKVAGIDA